MKTLYVDNYRGFTDTYIPFMDVNFLVGENSTGKTSILNLINLLMNPGFWFTPDFNEDDIDMGYFYEIVNRASDCQKYFDLGIEKRESGEEEMFKFIWMRFESENDIPNIKVCAIYNGKRTVHIKMEEKGVYFKFQQQGEIQFKNWIEKVKKTIDGEYKLLLDGKFSIRSKFFHILNLAQERSGHANTKKASIQNIIIMPFSRPLVWIAPIRAKARRIYEMYKAHYSADGEHMPVLLNSLLNSGDKSKKYINALFEFGKTSNLFDKIETHSLGEKKSSPFRIEITYGKLPMCITNVGYGVSQILPIIMQMLASQNKYLAIQQPEVHLHPRAQAAFGDFIYQSAKDHKNKFIIETHSDYTINRFRLNISKSAPDSSVKSQILFFERIGNETKAVSLPFKENGGYSDNTPPSYGKFFIDEELQILRI